MTVTQAAAEGRGSRRGRGSRIGLVRVLNIKDLESDRQPESRAGGPGQDRETI